MKNSSPDTTASNAAVELRSVSKVFGEDVNPFTAVQDCSFVVERGKFTVLIGPSGSGKTTLIDMIAGYEKPTTGDVLSEGKAVAGPGHDRLVVFQETALFPWMSTIDNVMYGPVVQRARNPQEIRSEAERLLEVVGLQDFHDKYPIQLSGGMQRRAELARALINSPRVLLMDEPFRGLDAMTRELMQEYLLKLFEGSDQTILFVTSEIDEAILFADRLIVLGASPGRAKAVIEDDLPRPRSLDMLTTERYARLKEEALTILYKEAVGAFQYGESGAADLVEAFERRQSE